MAKSKSSNEKERVIDNFDDVNDPVYDDATDNLHDNEHKLINAPVSLEHLSKYRAEFEQILKDTENELREFGYNDMTDAQRRRLLGSGIRRLGFIVKTNEIANDNQEFIPGFMELWRLRCLIAEITETRNIVICLEQLARIYNDILLVAGNDAFRLALMYYHSVQDAARRGVPGAQAIFRRLEAFFRRGRQTDVEEAEPTAKETIRKAKKLLEGKEDGTIVIEGHAKHTTSAEHTVIDDTYKPYDASFKETIEGVVCSGCHSSNPAHAKFCVNCGTKL